LLKDNEHALRQYIAGGAISFGIIILLLEGFRYLFLYLTVEMENIRDVHDKISIIFYVIHIVGGSIGSYMVARKKNDKYIQIGLVTGIIGFIIEYGFFYVSEGSFIGGYITLILILVGSTVGALISMIQRRITGAQDLDTS
jgi:predicted MFS family arabinose efflux permease